jgi:O-succinylbenzoate synthase
MPANLYQYKLPLKNTRWEFREGLVLRWDLGWGEIAPLPGFSRETFAAAKEEILQLLPDLSSANPKHASVRFGIACASKPFSLEPIDIPLCALGPLPDFQTMKLKLGHLPLSDAISLVKKYVNHHTLRIDCNRSWTLDQAFEFASHFEPTDFSYLEEPIQSFQDLIRFSKLTQFPIAVDESLLDSPWQEIPSLKALVVKPTVLGQIPTPPPGIDLILSSAYESGLGLIHIARLMQSSVPIGLDTYRALGDDLLKTPIQTAAGIFSWKSEDPFPIDLSKLHLIASAP